MDDLGLLGLHGFPHGPARMARAHAPILATVELDECMLQLNWLAAMQLQQEHERNRVAGWRPWHQEEWRTKPGAVY